MTPSAAAIFLLVAMAANAPAAGGATILVADPDGALARVAAPLRVHVDLEQIFDAAVDPRRLRLAEATETSDGSGQVVAVQFERDGSQSLSGTLWWLMPPGPAGERRFQLTLADQPTAAVLRARYDEERQLVDVWEGDLPVLRYNHGTVPPPPPIVEQFERGREHPLYYARGDYIHPLFGPDGEPVTDDYSLNHPHHRGVSWAWPVVRWKGEARDLWAVRVLPEQPGGVWARPVAMRQVDSGSVMALIQAQNVWKWGDREEIVREDVLIRAFRAIDRSRFVDVEIELTALTGDVSIGGRPGPGYGGFALRTFPEFDRRHIAMHVDPPGRGPRRAWLHLTGNFPGGKGPAGVALFEHVTNPGYPSYPNPEGVDGIPEQYPPWRSVLPCFPGSREVPLPKGQPLWLKHRLWIHPDEVDEGALSDAWGAYARDTKAVLVEPKR